MWCRTPTASVPISIQYDRKDGTSITCKFVIKILEGRYIIIPIIKNTMDNALPCNVEQCKYSNVLSVGDGSRYNTRYNGF
jgi:hypothetical protein